MDPSSARKVWHDGRHYETSAAFRHAQASHRATSSRRLIPLQKCRLRLTATQAGGNCGFQAAAWALIHFGIGGNAMCSTRVRELLAEHVRATRDFYVRRLVEVGIVPAVPAARDSVDAFCSEVRRQGIHGHWLGQMWGGLEIVALARALGVCVELYAFDVDAQRVRLYQKVEEGKKVVALLFTGEAGAGHFDLLLPVRRFWWWR